MFVLLNIVHNINTYITYTFLLIMNWNLPPS